METQTQKKIRYFTEKLNLKFALANIGKMIVLANEMKRYLNKEYQNKKDKLTIQWTSQDCRSYVTALEKTLRKANKYIGHMSIKDRLIKRTEQLRPLIEKETDPKKLVKLRTKAYDDENHSLAQYISLALQLQQLFALYNFFANVTYVFELIQEKAEKTKKEEDDNYLKQELEFIFFEIMKDEV